MGKRGVASVKGGVAWVKGGVAWVKGGRGMGKRLMPSYRVPCKDCLPWTIYSGRRDTRREPKTADMVWERP